jgi:CHAD domain-containing protein
MGDGKWITGLRATTPLQGAARRVLTVRLKVIRRYLPLALHHWKDDPEHIHQLRVGTRRAGAALDIFGLCLPKKIYKKARHGLRQLRRAAGLARDWDVFHETLAERQQDVPGPQQPGLDFLAGFGQAQRVAAQAGLESIVAKGHDFERLAVAAIAAVRPPRGHRPPRLLRDLARPWLAGILADLDEVASGDVQEYDRLHMVRILGKRLRYGMEIFAPCFGADFKTDLYPKIAMLQEILGCANDSHVAEQRLADLRELLAAGEAAPWKRFRPGVDGLLGFHRHRLSEQLRHFQHWWRDWRKSGADAALLGMLKPTKGPASAASD